MKRAALAALAAAVSAAAALTGRANRRRDGATQSDRDDLARRNLNQGRALAALQIECSELEATIREMCDTQCGCLGSLGRDV